MKQNAKLDTIRRREREAWDEQCRNKREWKIDAEQVSWGRELEFQNGRKGDGIVVKVIDCQRYPMLVCVGMRW